MKLRLCLLVAVVVTLLPLTVSMARPVAAARHKPVKLESSVIPVGNQPAAVGDPYIVAFRDDVADPKGLALQLGRDQRFAVRHVYRYAMKGFAARLPAAAVAALRNNPRIKAVVPDRQNKLLVQTQPTGIDRVDADWNATAKINTVDERVNVDVAVIDQAVDLAQPDLNAWAVLDCTTDTTFGAGSHGTHVAGTVGALDNNSGVVGVAPGARIWTFKVFSNAAPTTSDSVIICALDTATRYATDQGDGLGTIEVANLSLGRTGSDSACGGTDVYHNAYCRLVNAGVTTVVAAGNETDNAANHVPAAYDQVITVSALADSDGRKGGLGGPTSRGADESLANFSNFGADVDIAAPGVDILSTAPSGGLATLSGTSMASPHVAGAAALIKAVNPGASPATVLSTLRSTRELWHMAGDLDGVDEGLLNVHSSDASPPTKPVLTLSEVPASPNQFVRPGTTPILFYRPAAGQSGSFKVTAATSDPETGIKRVIFPVVFGADGSGDPITPYEKTYSWSAGATASGTKSVAAVNHAEGRTGSAFRVTPDTTAPPASITSPATGATVRSGVFIQAKAGDGAAGAGVARVIFRYCRGGTCKVIGTDTTAATGGIYAVRWTTQPANGTYILRAQAIDNVGNVGNSTTVTVTVRN